MLTEINPSVISLSVRQPQPKKKMKRIPLANLRYTETETVATLPGMKSIIRSKTARLVKWYHVMPTVGDSDAQCLLILKMPRSNKWMHVEKRIISEETARYA